MVTQELIAELAELHGATWERYPGPPDGGRLTMPNGAIVSLGWGFGHYCSARDGVQGLPMPAVEVAVWHDGIKGGDMLPDNDVHGWQSADDLRGLCQYAADLAP